MPILKYTMVKFIKSPSTWIVLVIAIAVTFLITGPVFYNALPKIPTKSQYTTFSTPFYSGMILLILFFGAIFCGFKGAQLYKDEVEDGTFLIVLSKPQSRSKIIFFKWLTMTILNVLFLLCIMIAFSVAVIIFEPNWSKIDPDIVTYSIKYNLPIVNGILFGIGMVLLFILSSIALMVSTKVSTGGTIGITIALGIAVQVTGIIGQFSTTSTYQTNFLNSINVRATAEEQYRDDNSKGYINQGVTEDSFIDLFVITYTLGITNTQIKGLPEPAGLGFTAIYTDQSVSFDYLSYIDLSYQVGLLGDIANSVISSSANSQDTSALTSAQNKMSAPGALKKISRVSTFTVTTAKSITDKLDIIINQGNQALNNFYSSTAPATHFQFDYSYFISLSSLSSIIENEKKVDNNPKFLHIDTVQQGVVTEDQKIKNIMFGSSNSVVSNNVLDRIQYSDFINKYGILVAYIIIAVVVAPASYFILRRQDFR